MPTSAIFTRQRDITTRRRGFVVEPSSLRAWGVAVAVGAVIASAGCATPPPCRCTCESCYGNGAYPPPDADANGAVQTADVPAGANEISDAGYARPSSPSKSGRSGKTDRRSRAGETLTESQLLARYEGKRPVQVLNGKATYYANSLAGRKTASGEPYLPTVFSAAHRTLPFGTVVRVVRTDTNKYVYVRITDRGPFAGGGRIIDLSYVAAERLGMIRAGVVPVRVEVLE